MRFEITTEPERVEPGDLVVFRLETKRGVKWSCGKVRCFTAEHEDSCIVLNNGEIPEYGGYDLICCIKSIPDEIQLSIDDEKVVAR